MKNWFSVFVLWVTFSVNAQSSEYEVILKVVNAETGIYVQDAQVYIQPCECGGITDRYGILSKNLARGTYKITTSFIGFNDDMRTVFLETDKVIEVSLNQKTEQLSEVVVRAKNTSNNIRLPQMGSLSLKTQELKKIPAGLGEYDVLRSMTLLAGVSNAGDVSNGLSVRGGL